MKHIASQAFISSNISGWYYLPRTDEVHLFLALYFLGVSQKLDVL